MKENSFKAKRIDNREWIEGIPFWIDHSEKWVMLIDHDENAVNPPYSTGSMCVAEIYCREIDLETICQYTGFSDKNKMRIFENHIVKSDNEKIGQVQWFEEHGAFMIWNITDNKVDPLYDNDFSKIEVIGNAFDDPELLKESEDEYETE